MERYVRYSDTSRFILLAMDGILIWLAFHAAQLVVWHSWAMRSDMPFFIITFALLWWLLSRQYANVYRRDRRISYGEKLRHLLKAFLLHGVLVVGTVVALRIDYLSTRYLAAIYGFSVVGVVVGRFGITFGYRTWLRYFARLHNRFVIVGASQSGQELYHALTADDSTSYQFKGFFTDEALPTNLRALRRGAVTDLMSYCLSTSVDEIYYALPLDRHDLIEELSRFAEDHFLAFRIVPDYQGTVGQDVGVYFHDHLPILMVRQEPLGFRTNQVLKRGFDLAFSLLVILGLFPIILPVLALLIKLDSPGPVFFRQMRPGKRNKLFPCYKLRTMRADHRQTELQATKADPRVTRVGAYLRKYNLDELPQFFNVLLGHMSVVGPRPNMVSQLEEYSKRGRTYQLRHAVTPGITGYAQVNGFRGETRAPNAMEKRVEYDLKYVQNWSFVLDLQIIGKTVRNMVKGEENAY
ncbi:exopolysaccharide biosynthesis polyprenyl glycosylphosphotransferase [Hymenobacter siberiensis]|uniref:exopolysaccharide biosynthesis polyprenyl glycosylphosphotransferase n=1 Tax=Hymenobacter siberiensis TaxID=2848396 RepID=UPI001D02229B|nr:exopolysaccharide biosynthesis polyprenyl glycosylphosphotransferase [Hymenobacter siberiensis]